MCKGRFKATRARPTSKPRAPLGQPLGGDIAAARSRFHLGPLLCAHPADFRARRLWPRVARPSCSRRSCVSRAVCLPARVRSASLAARPVQFCFRPRRAASRAALEVAFQAPPNRSRPPPFKFASVDPFQPAPRSWLATTTPPAPARHQVAKSLRVHPEIKGLFRRLVQQRTSAPPTARQHHPRPFRRASAVRMRRAMFHARAARPGQRLRARARSSVQSASAASATTPLPASSRSRQASRRHTQRSAYAQCLSGTCNSRPTRRAVVTCSAVRAAPRRRIRVRSVTCHSHLRPTKAILSCRQDRGQGRQSVAGDLGWERGTDIRVVTQHGKRLSTKGDAQRGARCKIPIVHVLRGRSAWVAF